MDGDAFDFLFKIVVIGDAGVGKTCVVQRFKSGALPSGTGFHRLLRFTRNSFCILGTFFEKQANTIGVDFVVKTVFVDGKRIKLQIWDTAGQERFRTITQSYYRSAHGVLIVYDVTKRDTYESIRRWLDDAMKYNAGSATIVLLIGNKADLPEHRQVHGAEAQELARRLEIVDYSTCYSCRCK
jgi:Ras-related protein Rab-43